jgi:ABC-type transport system involved in cytochrome c biogenesis permease subunit
MTHLWLLNVMLLGCVALAASAFIPRLRTMQAPIAGVTSFFGVGALSMRAWESWLQGYGHFPSANLFEAVTLITVFCVGLMLWVGRRLPGVVATTSVVVLLPLAGLLVYAEATGGADLRPLLPSLNSIWIQIHVPVTVMGYAAFLVAGLTGACALVALRRGGNGEDYALSIGRLLRVGFPLFSAGIVLGAIWAYTVWGSFWAWDPKETWALITWLYYAAAFHVGSTDLRRFSVWMVLGVPLTLFTFIGVNYVFSGAHAFGML